MRQTFCWKSFKCCSDHVDSSMESYHVASPIISRRMSRLSHTSQSTTFIMASSVRKETTQLHSHILCSADFLILRLLFFFRAKQKKNKSFRVVNTRKGCRQANNHFRLADVKIFLRRPSSLKASLKRAVKHHGDSTFELPSSEPLMWKQTFSQHRANVSPKLDRRRSDEIMAVVPHNQSTRKITRTRKVKLDNNWPQTLPFCASFPMKIQARLARLLPLICFVVLLPSSGH